ncbi:MAG TPA: protoporphyrinogen oxidase [Jatrophihabitantaceae bacterium]|jgi:oxygen-dependent protoporphyrinogen oxidase|nr:protoporphyrinogen oxidase [Jatrophihabitantaceae bacterium]
MHDDGAMRIVVIGGGISGLAAAWTLAGRLPGAEVIVLEGAPQVGGKLQAADVAGIRVDVGAEALLARRPEGIGLISELGLDDQMIAPLTTSARVRAGGVLHPLPARTMMGIPADLDAARASGVFGEATLARIAAEPDAEPLPPLSSDVAVGSLVRARLGDEVADRLVEPLLGGVYAGRSDALSLHATIPALFARLTEHGGSLIRAAQTLVPPAFPTARPDSGPESGRTVGGAVFASLRGGLGRLPLALAESGRFTVRTGTTVRELTRTATGLRLVTGPVPEPEVIDADAVVVASPATKAARLLRTVAPAAAGELAGIEYASMVIATFAFRGVDLPDGSGLLVSAREGLAVKGVTISSHKWPLETSGGVAGAGDLTVLRASIGRAGEAQELQRDDDDLLALARRDLRSLLGLTAEPVDALLTRWGGGLPQYAVGHVERVARIQAAVQAVPGLAVCGAAYDGVGIPACIASAQRAADHVANALSVRGQ